MSRGMQLYFQAASFLDELDLKTSSIKAVLTAQNLPPKESSRLLALVIETLKQKATIQTLLGKTPLSKEDKKVLQSKSKNLPLVLVQDLLFAKRPGIQSSSGPIKDAIVKHKTRLQAELTRLKIKKGVKTNKELELGGGLGDQIPRYVRINTNLVKPEDMISKLQTCEGGSFTLLAEPVPDALPPKSFHLDPHIPSLLVFPTSSTALLTASSLYTSGQLILQDKASHFPSFVLSPPPNAVVIDGTAAPGNKTTHLSALMSNRGRIDAFELSPARWKVLDRMVKRAGCENVKVGNEGGRNFLETDPKGKEWEAVTHILLDPSCSGSGIVNRLDFLTDDVEEENEEAKKDRLAGLATFQLSMIRHAMKYTSAQKIVYSTCSVHPEEDELVVLAALDSSECKSGGWTLAERKDVLPSWERRGRKEVMGQRAHLADSLICCEPGTDKTNGFFVSCFLRAPPHGLAATGPMTDAGTVGTPAASSGAAEDKKRKAVGEEGEPESSGAAPAESKRKKKKKKKQPSSMNG